MKNSEILKAVRSKIDRPEKWARGHWALNAEGVDVNPRHDSAVAWCAISAFELLDFGWHETDAAKRLLSDAINLLHPGENGCRQFSIVSFNDNCEHPELMSAFNAAIGIAEVLEAEEILETA